MLYTSAVQCSSHRIYYTVGVDTLICYSHFCMGVWQGVTMDSPMYHYGLPCPTILCPASSHPCDSLTAVAWVATRREGCPQSRQPAAVLYPLGYPMLYASVFQCSSHRIYSTVGVDSIFNKLWRFSPFFAFWGATVKRIKFIRIAYVIRVRYLEKTQESLRPALISFAYCINLDKHS
jgi:hypothetical protein